MTTVRPQTVTLLLIDVQNDFHPGGSLAIPTAHEDAIRIAALIDKFGNASVSSANEQEQYQLTRIVATMDTHPVLHIAHPKFWINPIQKNHPDPFTIITTQDIMNGKWKPRTDLYIPSTDIDLTIFTCNNNNTNNDDEIIDSKTGIINLEKYCIEYTKRLEQNGRFQLCIWPEHCIMGSYGHCIVPIVQEALNRWTIRTGRNVEYIYKGQNILTEMYSALRAEVPTTIVTSMNTSLQQSVRTSTNILLVAGQAMSHCVNYTLRDLLLEEEKEDNEEQQQEQQHGSSYTQHQQQRVYLLTDCASAVPGFESAAIQFQQDMISAGVACIASTELFFFGESSK